MIQDFELGGTPVVLLRLIKSLDRRRFKPQLALMNARGALLEQIPSDCEVFDLRKGKRRGFPHAIARYASLEARVRPDVVISALPNANILCCLAHQLRATAPPLVVTEHVAHISYLGDSKHRFTPFAVRRIYSAATRVVAVSDGLKDELAAFYDIPAERLARIYNPIDIAQVRAAARQPLDVALPQGLMIVTVGRLAEQKAPHDILTAFSLIAPTVDAHLVFVGDGPLRPSLEAAVLRQGLSSRVLFAGSDSNPFRWMNRADVFVSASVFEGFSLTIAEAMAAGVPVVATDCPWGPSELLLGGRCGVLAPPRRPELLADAIGGLLADKERAKVLVDAATERVKEFDQQHIVAQYEALIEEVA